MSDPQEPHDSPVFARARGLDPRIASPVSSWGLVLGIGAIALLGILVFVSLQSGREARLKAAERAAQLAAQAAKPQPIAPPPVVAAPQPAPPPPAAPSVLPPAQAVLTPPTQMDEAARRRAPALVVDFSGALVPLAAPSSGPGANSAAAGAMEKLTDNERFSERISGQGVDTTRASRLNDPSRIAAQGTVIPAVLETAINSDTPGFARAVVSRDVRGFDGARVLIPRGSKLVGQYKSGVADGQSRAFVIWSRILTPEGVSIDVDSPASDPQGRGGIAGEVDSHFLRRFGSAILLSVITGGINALAAHAGGGNNTAIVIGTPAQATDVASVALQKQIDIPVTIKVPQGEPIRVFVARDLDFSAVEPALAK